MFLMVFQLGGGDQWLGRYNSSVEEVDILARFFARIVARILLHYQLEPIRKQAVSLMLIGGVRMGRRRRRAP
jgi:hypothetical protein